MDIFLFEQNRPWQQKRYAAGTERELLSRLLASMDIDQVRAISGGASLRQKLPDEADDRSAAGQRRCGANYSVPEPGIASFATRPAVEVLDDAWNSHLKIFDR